MGVIAIGVVGALLDAVYGARLARIGDNTRPCSRGNVVQFPADVPELISERRRTTLDDAASRTTRGASCIKEFPPRFLSLREYRRAAPKAAAHTGRARTSA